MNDFEARHEFGNREANLEFLRRTQVLDTTATVLEVGSGKGGLLHHLLAQGLNVKGVEVNQWMVDESRRLFGELPISRVTGTALPFDSGTFDIVLSFDVIEHIPDSDAHVAEVRRVLKPGGRYLFQTPNKWTNSLFETLRWRSFTAWRADHCSLHSYGDIRRRFASHGFTVEHHAIPVVTDFFKRKLRHYLGPLGMVMLRVVNPDRLPMPLRTNFYVVATKQS